MSATLQEHHSQSALPGGSEVRGFALYVGQNTAALDPAQPSINEIVNQLRKVVQQLAPGSASYAAVALAPAGTGGHDLDVVRIALGEPAALAQKQRQAAADRAKSGVVLDLSRQRVLLDNVSAQLTFREFELLQFLVLREGRTVAREEIVATVWADAATAPSARTIDVHVRRLRAKLGDYQDIVRTVRGVGYRFDRHADVSIRHQTGPSPDVF